MTNDSEKYDAATGFADPELERLLTDAYSAPDVPRSLLKKIDEQVQAEWGASPRLADDLQPTLGTRVVRGVRRMHALPWVAALSFLAMIVLVMNVGSTSYAWSKVLEAMAREGITHIETTDGEDKWLALADGVIGESDAETVRITDHKHGSILFYRRGSGQVQRQLLPGDAFSESSLAARFLLGGLVPDQELASLRVTEQHWEKEGDHVRLHVKFQSDSQQTVALQLELDPETHLPRSYAADVADAKIRSQLGYARGNASGFQQQLLSDELAVVDVPEISDDPLVPGPNQLATTEPSFSADSSDSELTNESPAEPGADSDAADPATERSPDAGSVALAVEDRLSAWADEAPSQWQPVPVSAHAADDVTREIGKLLDELWVAKGIEPVRTASDEELLRRVYLDLAGRTPSVHEVRAYLADEAPDRYERLVDHLLASSDHASHLAAVWRTFLIPDGVDLSAFGGIEAFDEWLAQRFASGASYDEIVSDLLLAKGRLSRSGPLLFYSAAKLNADELASRTARVFLGMRLECAQCHDHPFEPWAQEDFWGFAAFFARISRPQAELETVSTVMRVHDVDYGEVTMPYDEEAIPPKFLNSTSTQISKADAGKPETGNREAGSSEAGDSEAENVARRAQLVRWLTSPDNPYFARATANRVWGHLFGKGIVDPIDDFGVMNKPKSPELLDLLAGELIRSEFDLGKLIRAIVVSDPYRLSSGATDVDPQRLEWFAQMNVKTLTAEQVYDCIAVATLLESAPGNDPYSFTVSRFGNGERDQFLQQFRAPVGRATEYQAGIPQALTLMNGSLIDGATGLARGGLLASLEAPFFTNQQRIEVLYLATLSRKPTAGEWELLRDYVAPDASGQTLQEGLADILWVLLNSAEFTMNH